MCEFYPVVSPGGTTGRLIEEALSDFSATGDSDVGTVGTRLSKAESTVYLTSGTDYWVELTHGVGSEIARIEDKLDKEAARLLVNNVQENLGPNNSQTDGITTAEKIRDASNQALLVTANLGFFIVNVIYARQPPQTTPAGSFSVKQWDHMPHSDFDTKIVFAHHLNESHTYDSTALVDDDGNRITDRETDGTWLTGGIQVSSAEVYWTRTGATSSVHAGWALSFLCKDIEGDLAVYTRYIYRPDSSNVPSGESFTLRADWDIVRFPLG